MKDRTFSYKRSLTPSKVIIKRQSLQRCLTQRFQIFGEDVQMAWRVLQLESFMYTGNVMGIDKIQKLTQQYVKIIEKLNSLCDVRQQYFTYKMHKLMSEPYIIRCFNNNFEKKQNFLQTRRKELQHKLEKESDKQNYKQILEQAMNLQAQKQKKAMKKIKQTIDESDRRLIERIKKRKLDKLSRINSNDTSLIISLNSSLNVSPIPQTEVLTSNSCSSLINQFQLQIKDLNFKLMKKQIQNQDQKQFKQQKRELQSTKQLIQ